MSKTKEKNITAKDNSMIDLVRVTRTVYFFVGVLTISTIIFDSWNLITPESVTQRWTIAMAVFVINTLVWLLSYGIDRTKTKKYILTTILSIITIALAGLMTYWERGMASTSTILYVFPLLIIAILHNRHLLISITAISAATYSLASVKYFNNFFNEGYRIQLWGNIFLYSGLIIIAGWLIMILVNLRHDSR